MKKIKQEINLKNVNYKNLLSHFTALRPLNGLIKKDSWEKAAFLLKQGMIGVIPTGTIYGIVGKALDKEVVEKIYKLKKRSLKKPMMILISSQNELKKFGVKISQEQKKILEKIWSEKVSIILDCPLKKFSYLHRNKNSLAFRIPKKKKLLKTLLRTGPLVASSANQESKPYATTIAQAKKYFNNKIFYLNEGKINSKPSTLVKLTKNKLEILRLGAEKINLKNF
ncbi:MAG: L-threonylcarbamoyladenylate synthase [Patescibacteria group bacterium]